ncbi:MAG TPA: glycoside hydrolase family 44 protein [Polyangiaceae bacterium]|nr:glycoside hydrolase family 44 protein [Polyangiaceae bacterium]
MRLTRLPGVAAMLVVATWGTTVLADVTVDAAADNHAISPLVYGVNFPSADQITQGNLTVMRRGGNATTRYNYLTDVHNSAADWFFENIPDCAGCSNPKDQSSANAFLKQASDAGLVALFTIPTIGWMPKSTSPASHPYLCGCPKTVTASQECFDPYDSNCGDGHTGGNCNSRGSAWVTCGGASATSEAADPTFEKGWVSYLVSRFGASGGKRIYELDNEPALWSSTHHDVHPERLGYDELWQRMRDYGAAVLEADPTAELAGPVEWGWPNYFCSDLDVVSNGCSANSPDRKNHGGTELVAWLLDQAKAYEQSQGKRILHYLDLHYYPQGGSGPERTRSLWDPTYTDPSWINDQIRLIPRMRDWVSQHYPGTKISISEWDFYDHDSATGAVTYAEVLGTFGREGLDLATAWAPPAATERAFSAFKLFRNYDGSGGAFESTNVRATSTDSTVKAFAATGATGLTLVLANEGGARTVNVTLSNFDGAGTASVYSNDGSANVSKKASVGVSGGTLAVPVGATTITMVVIPNAGGAPPGSGGASGNGGTSSGGTSNSGGATSSGGTSNSGGGTSNGGTSGASGGTANAGSGNGTGGESSATGGTPSATGGATNGTAGTASGSGGAGQYGTNGPDGGVLVAPEGADSSDSGGCSTSSRGASGRSTRALVGAVLVALGAYRRRRRQGLRGRTRPCSASRPCT